MIRVYFILAIHITIPKYLLPNNTDTLTSRPGRELPPGKAQTKEVEKWSDE